MSNRTKSYVQIACWLTPKQRDALARVAERTRLTKQVLLREAIDRLVRRYEGRRYGR
jgi:predicted transcriptional regulator